MKAPGKKTLIVLIALPLLLVVAGAALWLSLPGIISGKITAALRDAGFAQAHVGKVGVYYNAAHIQDIAFTNAENGPGIGEVEVYYSLANLLSGRIDRIFVDKIVLEATQSENGLQVTGMAPPDKDAPPTDIAALLKDFPVNAVEMKSLDLRADLQGEVITINLAGRAERGSSGDVSLRGRLRGRSENVDISAKLEGTIKPSGALKLGLNIDEASLDHPLISTNRFTGWANLNVDAGGETGLNTEIAAGVLDIDGVKLRGVTLTYTSQNTAHHLIARARAADEGGEFILDYDATPGDAASYIVTATIDAKDAALDHFPQLAALTGRKVGGTANVSLNITCATDTPFPANPAMCDQTGGKGSVNLNNFSLENLFSDAVAKLDLSLGTPDGGGIALNTPEGAEISLVPGPDFPALEEVTGFAGERLTVNLSTDGGVTPSAALLADGALRISGGFAIAGRKGNAVNGTLGAVTFRPGFSPLPDIDAQNVHLHTMLGAIDTKALKSDQAIFDFTGDIHLDGAEQSLALMPHECVVIKAHKLNAGPYRPKDAFDNCIPPAEDKTAGAWVKVWFDSTEDGTPVIARTQYNGGIPTLPLDLTLEDADGPYRISGVLPKGDINLALDKNFMPVYVRAAFKGGGKLATSKAPFTLGGFDGTVAYSAVTQDTPARLDTKLEISRFAHIAAHRPWFTPLSLSFESSTNLETQEMEFTASAMNDVGSFVAELAGTHRLNKDSGYGTFKIYPVDFGLIAPPMQDAFPVLRNWVNQATGKLSVDTALQWANIFDDKPVLDGSGTVTLEDGVLDTQDVTAAGIYAKIQLDDIWPLTLPPGQSLTIKAADIGIPLTDGEILFSLTADNILDIAKFDWKLAGGVIRTEPFAMPLDTLGKTIQLEAKDIDLAQLATMADIDGLAATGVLNGTIPVKVSPQGFDINNGLLKALGNGVIRYNPDNVPPALAGSNQQITTVRDALKNLQYDKLSMEISGGSEGSQNIALHISGKNPDFYGGHPVELNLNLDGDLGALIRQSLNALGYTDQIIRDTLENQSENGNDQ